jgi:hypothetical protein
MDTHKYKHFYIHFGIVSGGSGPSGSESQSDPSMLIFIGDEMPTQIQYLSTSTVIIIALLIFGGHRSTQASLVTSMAQVPHRAPNRSLHALLHFPL